MRRLFLAILGLAFAATTAEARTEPVRAAIKIEDSRVYVRVTAGKAASGWFILDTGASPTLVDERFAEAMHVTGRNGQMVGGAGAGTSRQSEVGKVRLKVGGVPLIVAKAGEADFGSLLGPTSGRKPAGIIGSQFFREHVVEVDFRRKELRIWPRGTDLSRRYARSVPVTFNGWTPIANAELTLPSGKRLPERVLIDLGAKSTLLIPEPFIAKHDLDGAFTGGATLPLGAGIGGNTFYRFVRAPRVALQGSPALAIEEPVVGLSVNGTLRSDWHEGLLGIDYLSRFAVAFDYSRSRVLLTRLSAAAEPLDRSGLFIVWDDDPVRYTVRDVLAGGPGEVAGVRAGDELVSIGNRPAVRLSLTEIRGLLKSAAAEVPIVVRRGDERLPLTIRLKDLV